MARAVLLALACGSLAGGSRAGGVRYGDYAGARMPHYGGDYDARAAAPPADDYQHHSPDAPAPLDYKYEEVSSDKVENPVPLDTHEDDSWNKPHKKRMNEKPLDDVELDDLNKYKIDEDPKFQNKYRAKIEARQRNRNKIRTDEALRRRVTPGRDPHQMLNVDEEDNPLHAEDFRDDNLEIEVDKNNFDNREIKPKVRRKPRDRPNINSLSKVDNEDEDNLSDIRDMQKSLRGQAGQEYAESEDARGRGRAPARVPPRDVDDELVAPLPAPGRAPKLPKNYDEYADYYDMNRVPTFKKKPRRTKASGTTTEHITRRIVPSRRTRRPFLRRTEHASSPDAPPASAESSPIMRHFTTSPVSPDPDTVNARRSHENNEMSIAEKSRLSILKKAQRKESSKNGTSTEKPPVLLQVTEKIHTLVMVEPPLHQDPWMRAKEVSDDSPERLQQVKKLMRRKLVANAKDIRDLTDNWHEVVCDYVDVGMLDAHATFIHSRKAYNTLLLTLPIVHLIFGYI